MKKKKKQKECPECKTGTGPRTLVCSKCGHKFVIKNAKKKIASGKKCPECTHDLKKRAKECDKCGYKYPVKGAKKKYEPVKDWTKLKAGNLFFIQKRDGAGPYYITETPGQKVPAGTRIEMGYRGRFIVDEVHDKGISVFYEGGLGFIYMGPEEVSVVTGLIKIPHKLYRKIV